MLRTYERHSRENKYEFAPEKCEVVPPVCRKDTQTPVELYGETLKEVDRYMYLGIPFGTKDSTQEGCAR